MAKSVEQVAHKFAKHLDLPSEVVMDLPKLTMIGNLEVVIENHRGLLEYTPERVRVRYNKGTVVITGSNLRLEFLYREEIKVEGRLKDIEFTS